jgi:hypothetical protein
MATAFDTFNQYAGVAYEGMLNDLSMADIETFVPAGTVDIPFGRGLVKGTAAKSGQLPTAAAGYFIGINVFRTVAVSGQYPGTLAQGNPVGAARIGLESSNISFGRVWVKTIGGATAGQQAYMVPLTGEITNATTAGNHLIPGARFVTDAAANGLAILQLQGKGQTTLAA